MRFVPFFRTDHLTIYKISFQFLNSTEMDRHMQITNSTVNAQCNCSIPNNICINQVPGTSNVLPE